MRSVDDDVDPNFTRIDHDHVDPGFCQRTEHANGNARVAPQADSAHRQLSDIGTAGDSQTGIGLRQLLNDIDTRCNAGFGYGEAQVGESSTGVTLHDHVDRDLCGGDVAKDTCGDAGHVGYTEDGHTSLAVIEGNIIDRQLFHAAQLFDDGEQVTGTRRRWCAGRNPLRRIRLLFQFEFSVNDSQAEQCLVARDER